MIECLLEHTLIVFCRKHPADLVAAHVAKTPPAVPVNALRLVPEVKITFERSHKQQARLVLQLKKCDQQQEADRYL